MISIEKKIITQDETLAIIFYSARKEKKKSLAEIAKELLIHPKYLRMLETGDYKNFPGPPYNYQFVKKYSEYLGLDSALMWKRFLMEQNIYYKLINKNKNKKEYFTAQNTWQKIKNFFNIPKIVLNIFVISFISLFFIYFIWSFYGTNKVPNLEIYTPKNNLITKDLTINVKGKVDLDADVLINGKYVLVNNKEGFFSEQINLHPGINVIKISAKKKQYKKEAVLYRQIMVLDDKDLSKK